MLAACVISSGEKHFLSGMDSDLEAFSRYPTDGSFAGMLIPNFESMWPTEIFALPPAITCGLMRTQTGVSG